MLCNANPRDKENKNQQKTMVIKSKAMKHKDYVKKTQLN